MIYNTSLESANTRTVRKGYLVSGALWLLLVFVLWVTPFLSVQEISQFGRGELNSLSTFSGSLALKAVKDILLVMIYVLAGVIVVNRKKVSPMLLVFMGSTFFSALISFVNGGGVITIMGLRWAMPMLLVFINIDFENTAKKKRQLVHVFSLLLLVLLVLQVYQLFNFPHWYGTNIFGLAARVSGYFLVPNTAAFFACVAYAVILFFSKTLKKRVYLAHIAVPIIIFITQSGTGVLTYLALCSLYLVFYSRARSLYVILGGASLAASLFFVNEITGRADFLELSGGGRIKVFFDILERATLIPLEFGFFSNSGNLMVGRLGLDVDVVAADSLLASYIGNYGLLGFVLFAFLWVRLYKLSVLRRNKELIAVGLVYLLFSFTTIYSEAFPMSILLPFIVWLSSSVEAKGSSGS